MSTSSIAEEWEDVTDVFKTTKDGMAPGRLLSSPVRLYAMRSHFFSASHVAILLSNTLLILTHLLHHIALHLTHPIIPSFL